MSFVRDLEEILKKQDEEMASDAEKDFANLEYLASSCLKSMLENKIYIVDDDKVSNTRIIGEDVSISKFNELIESLSGEEDIINSNAVIETKRCNALDTNNFTVYYPHYKRDDLLSVKVEIIENVSEFIEKVIYAEKSLESKKTFYRGHGDWQYGLLPGIYRPENENILSHESEYIKEIISSYPQYFVDCKTALDFLAVLQHNGFPTRLLDFSENPLIALYMACASNNQKHADTIRITIPKTYFKYYDSDTVSVLTNIAFAEDNFTIKDFKIGKDTEPIKKFNQRADVIKLVHLIRNEKPYFKPNIIPEHLNGTILFVKPKQAFDRISHQSGLFALFGICNDKKSMPEIEEMYPPCEITHYIIPTWSKKKILEELSYINITEASVYCDMEHIAKHYINKSRNHEIDNIIEETEDQKRKEMESIFK